MRTLLASAVLFAPLVLCVVPASAEPDSKVQAQPRVGPGQGAGTRAVTSVKAARERGRARNETSPNETDGAPVKAKGLTSSSEPPVVRRGVPPKEPSPTLPEGVPPTSPKVGVRRSIAQGPLMEDGDASKDDPELRVLHDAELVLFPRPLEGAEPGWSWDLPQPSPRGPTVTRTGVPPAMRLAPSDPPRRPTASDARWLESLTMPNLPVRLDTRVVKYLKFYRDNPDGQAILRAWTKKSGRYTSAMKAELARHNVPTDLVWLSLIESGHNPTITSPAGAAGLWQFVPESGRLYGLAVDRWVDERLDPQRSSQAAARFLSDLYQRFGSWELAIAAYNMGYGGMSRAIRKYNTNDFWELSRHEAGVPWETVLYVPKIMAIAIVMNNKRAFGIDGIKPDEAVQFDTVLVKPGLPLSRVAAAAEVSLPEIAALNPQLCASRVPPASNQAAAKGWQVHVPAGKGPSVSRQLAKVDAPADDIKTYVVRFGDTAESIAKSARTSERALRELNELGEEGLIEPGTVLLVPRAEPGSAKAEMEVVVVSSNQYRYPDRRRVFYVVRGDEHLEEIAAAFGVTQADLSRWNAVNPAARLQSGMALQIFVPSGADLRRVRFVDEANAKILPVGSDEFFEHFEGLNGKKRMLVTVKEGDTLDSIGKRYGMTIGSMERVNRRSRTEELAPGETVIVYAPRTTPQNSAAQTGVAPKALPPIEAPHPEALPGASDPAFTATQ